MAKSSAKKWILNLLRIGVCVVGLYLVVRGVSWQDRAALPPPDGRVLFGEIREDDATDTFTVRPGGGEPLPPLPRTWPAVEGSTETRHADIHYGLRTVLREARIGLLVAALFVFAPGTFIQGKRFQWMLRAQEIQIGYWESLKLCYVGNFLNFAYAIGGTAGDMYKMYCIARHAQRKTESVMSVLLDRVAGLIGLVLLVGIMAMFTPKLAPFRWVLAAILGIGASAAFLYFWAPIRRRVPATLLDRVPKIDFLRKIDRTACNLVHHRQLTAGAILSTMLLQIFCTGSYVVAAGALGMKIGTLGRVFEYFAYFGTGWMITVIPISVQGAGAVELFYTEVFKPYGSVSQILCLALAVRVVQIVSSLPGGLLFLLGVHHLPTPQEMEDLEHESDPAGPD
ncbi:MAG: flippase-like domain-containing protein [Phycisphaerales bacterium]|nr:flippase-like domain-containing protein [Phycisphaerales bacterium]